jgi:parvulin-like peptidyl-prolyl isomerase
MAMRFHAVTCIMVSALTFVAACGDSNKKKADGDKGGIRGEALARIDDTVITVGDLERRINEQSPYARGRYKAQDKQKELLGEMVRLEVFVHEAERRGLQNDPEVARTIKQLLAQRLLKDELGKVRLEDITESAARHYFDDHLSVFNQPEQVEVAWILVKDAGTARRVLADPRIKQPAGDPGFRALVAEYSQDGDTKDRGGQLSFFDDTSTLVPKEVIEAAFNLANPGDVSQPVKTPKGVAVLKLVARKKAVVRQFDEVKQQIRNVLYREQQEKRKSVLEDELRQKMKVRIDDSKLASVRVQGAADLPSSALPPGNSSPVGSDNQSPASP